eukprot:379620-Prymnesium_polylepis.1
MRGFAPVQGAGLCVGAAWARRGRAAGAPDIEISLRLVFLAAHEGLRVLAPVGRRLDEYSLRV